MILIDIDAPQSNQNNFCYKKFIFHEIFMSTENTQWIYFFKNREIDKKKKFKVFWSISVLVQ